MWLSLGLWVSMAMLLCAVVCLCRQGSQRAVAGVLACIALGVMSQGAVAQDDFLEPDKAFQLQAAMADPLTLDIHFKIAPEYYMYRERFGVRTDPSVDTELLGELVFPAGLVKFDPTFEKDLEVYYGSATVRVPLAPGKASLPSAPFTVIVASQGCADAGLCYPPAEHMITLEPAPGGFKVTGPYAVTAVPAPQATGEAARHAGVSSQGGGLIVSQGAPGGLGALFAMGDTAFAAELAQSGVVHIVLASFVLGMLLSFTPCVLPMVPILLAVLVGTDTSPEQRAPVSATRRHWRGFSLAAVFVLGMSVVYTALGVTAGLVGASLAIWLQTPWVIALFALVLVALALAMFDVYTFQAPGVLQHRLTGWMNRLPGGRYGAVLLMGMLSSLVVGPCVAAPLAGVLLFISKTGDVALGGTALFAMAWGSGVLLLAVGASAGGVKPRAGAWMERVKHVFGVLLLATAWWMLNPLLPSLVFVTGWVVFGLWCAALLGAFSRWEQAGPWALLCKAVGLMLAIWSVLILVGLAAGGQGVLQPLRPFIAATDSSVSNAQVHDIKSRFVQVDSIQALDAILAHPGRPVLLDFYADWCVSCIEMERFTFTDPRVAALMSDMVLLQIDVTANTPEHRALLKRFDLFGPPGIIFFNAQGQELPESRVVGFMKADRFASVLDQVMKAPPIML